MLNANAWKNAMLNLQDQIDEESHHRTNRVEMLQNRLQNPMPDSG